MNLKKLIISGLLLISGSILCVQQKFLSKTFSLSIDGKGNITALEVLPAGKNLVAKDSAGVLLQVVKDGKRYKPESAMKCNLWWIALSRIRNSMNGIALMASQAARQILKGQLVC